MGDRHGGCTGWVSAAAELAIGGEGLAEGAAVEFGDAFLFGDLGVEFDGVGRGETFVHLKTFHLPRADGQRRGVGNIMMHQD